MSRKYFSIFEFLCILLMNLWVYPLLLLWTLLGSIIAMPALWTCRIVTRWPAAKIMQRLIWIYGRVCIMILRPFIHLRCEDLHRDFLPKPGIIIMNHYSFLDTYFLCQLPIVDAHICLRSWPFRMVWYSAFMRIAEYFDLEDSSWEETKQNAAYVKQHGRYLVIFPEGHRSRTGRIQRFYSGAFKLAVHFDLPILPLCISGTQTLLPPGRMWLKPAHIQMQLLPPIYPKDFTGEKNHIEMRRYVKKQMVHTIEKMQGMTGEDQKRDCFCSA